MELQEKLQKSWYISNYRSFMRQWYVLATLPTQDSSFHAECLQNAQACFDNIRQAVRVRMRTLEQESTTMELQEKSHKSRIDCMVFIYDGISGRGQYIEVWRDKTCRRYTYSFWAGMRISFVFPYCLNLYPQDTLDSSDIVVYWR